MNRRVILLLICKITSYWSPVRAMRKNGPYSWTAVVGILHRKSKELHAWFSGLPVAVIIDHTDSCPHQELTLLCSSMQWLKSLLQQHLCHFCWARLEFSRVERWTCSPYNIICFIYCFFHITLWDSNHVILQLWSCMGWPITVIKEFGMR